MPTGPHVPWERRPTCRARSPFRPQHWPPSLWHRSCTRVIHPIQEESVKRYAAAAVITFVIAACSQDSPNAPNASPPPSSAQASHIHIMPLIGQALPGSAPTPSPTLDNGIYFHGGPVILAHQVSATSWVTNTIYAGGPAPGATGPGSVAPGAGPPARSEEHTSELQSLRHLVCRLLLEKKKKTTHQ